MQNFWNNLISTTASHTHKKKNIEKKGENQVTAGHFLSQKNISLISFNLGKQKSKVLFLKQQSLWLDNLHLV